jgi:putative acetyltransferase
MPLTVASPADPRAVALMNAQQQELRAVYQDQGERTEPFDPAILSGEGSVLLVWEEGGELLACGALKLLDAGSAEVKRMYTRPEARGRGLGREVLNGLILQGQQLGYERLLLETGDLQPEAIKLYQTAGFVRIPNFGYYVGIENSLCFELRL